MQFLVDASLVKSARLLLWLVFFFFFVKPQTSPCMYHFLCTVNFYQKYLVLDFERIQASNRKYKTIAKQKGPHSQFSGTMSHTLFGLCETFLSSPPSIFFDILQQTGFSENPKGSPFHIFKNFALFEL